MENPYPILEFDPERSAILEPGGAALDGDCPRRAVMCFFQEVLAGLAEEGRIHPIGQLKSEMGPHRLYGMETEGERILVFHPGVGAPLAAGLFEEAIRSGVSAFIACGGCGVLLPDIAVGHPVILTSAVRDEGTSYHYLPPGREAAASPRPVAALEQVFKRSGVDYRLGKSWTTDGFYRETQARRALRMAEGCCVVEMEAAAFFAVAQFRGVEFGQVVYGGDLVVPEGWDERGWNQHRASRELLFKLAVEAVLLL